MYFFVFKCHQFCNTFISNRPNIPCSAELSEECSIIYGQFGVPLFNGGTGEGKKEPLFLALFWHFSDFFFNFTHSLSDFIFTQAKNLIFKKIKKEN